ncbi:MAG: tRNA pseudouridine(38-40) synthase TruA [Vulcanimicrobiaceae bacterium]
MPTVRMIVEYDGTAFYGMQWQPNVRTVGGTLEALLSQMFDEPIKVTSAGRTDTGVHASGQVISFTPTRENFPWDRLRIALNSRLPSDLSIRHTEIIDGVFSARFSALERTYVYALYHHRAKSALLSRYAAQVWRDCDWSRFNDGARYLLGEHDFRSFCGVLPESGPTIRTLRELRLESFGMVKRIVIRADGFLHRMVRTMVGTLLECADGRRDPASLTEVLAARDRKKAGLTAPACGLYLAGVRYADGFNSFSEPPVFALAADLAVHNDDMR